MKQRIITGLVGGALFLLFILWGGAWFVSLISFLAFLALFELLRLTNIGRFSLAGCISYVYLGVLLWALYQRMQGEIWHLLEVEHLLMGFVFMILLVPVMTKNRFSIEQAGVLLIGLIYIAYGFFYFIETRVDHGVWVVFFILFLVWTTDTGAYFIGKKIGKRKLWPSISPNKTIAGFVGGIFSAIVIGVLLQFWKEIWTSLSQVFLLSISISIIGQLGDLVESALKRHYQVKDSGSLLPGHGGVLDRFDSLLYVFPILHLLQLI